MTEARSESYGSGPSTLPLLGETIGANLRRIAARFPTADAVIDLALDLRYT